MWGVDVLAEPRVVLMENEKPVLDWRGKEIKEGTRVLWRNSALGTVLRVYEIPYKWCAYLDIAWEERQFANTKSGPGRGIAIHHVTVWPDQPDDQGFRELLMKVVG